MATEQERIDYWSSYMDEMLEFQNRVMPHPVEECGDPLLPIPDAMEGIEVLYSDTKLAGTFERIYYIRSGILDDLVAIAREMNERGWILKIEDAYRSMEMQTALVGNPGIFEQIVEKCKWESGGETPSVDLVSRRLRLLVANCGKFGTHTQGCAVDISVYNRNDGSEVWRGKPYLHMSELTPMESPFISADDLANRLAISELVESHGFIRYPAEFWHYNKGDVMHRQLTGSSEPGIYGSVHFNPETGETVPYDDILAPLVPDEQLAILLEAAMNK
ncbi:MAG: hypothetical protein HRT89_00950 [Lentisphaeria bacterium]|nr:hypothetical protein [Lentisphaeria bacterium]NQZ66611.1 hypothetical protein [Lentisphaeria bacterium]